MLVGGEGQSARVYVSKREREIDRKRTEPFHVRALAAAHGPEHEERGLCLSQRGGELLR